MQRFEDWDLRLARLIELRWLKPFTWGTNDCCLFACDAVREMTGVDLAVDFRGRYDDRNSAKAVMLKFARGGVRRVAEKIAGQHKIQRLATVRLAQRGDVVALRGGPARSWMLGIVAMNGAEALAPIGTGLAAIPIERCEIAWRIG